MKKKEIVKNKLDFDKIISQRKFVKSKSFVIYYKNNSLGYGRFGISVGKKLGNAVFRNKYKRKIRSIIDIYKKDYSNGIDYIIILRGLAKEKSFQELKEDFNNLMSRIEKG